jgi:hypothetical protein
VVNGELVSAGDIKSSFDGAVDSRPLDNGLKEFLLLVGAHFGEVVDFSQILPPCVPR